MGYCSDVSIGMSFKNREELAAFLGHVRLSSEVPKKELAAYTVTVVGTEGVLLHAYFGSVKWYTDYPDVACHHTLLSMAADAGAGTAFVRIGEDYGDIEVDIDMNDTDVDLYGLFGVSREVYRPDSGAPISDFLSTTKE